MFNYLLKSIPAEFAFAGYSVRKSVTVMTQVIDGRVVYDIFLYTYLDNYLSFYILMDDGTYKCVDEKNVRVGKVEAEELTSRHLFRGEYYDISTYPTYDKEQIIGVFGLRDIKTLMKQVDDMEAKLDVNQMSLQATMDNRPAYTGMEIMGAINRFNKALQWRRDRITLPAIQYDTTDTFRSPIGDEFDFFDFMSGKDSDTLVRDFKELDDKYDGVGNKKEL